MYLDLAELYLYRKVDYLLQVFQRISSFRRRLTAVGLPISAEDRIRQGGIVVIDQHAAAPVWEAQGGTVRGQGR